MGGHLGNFSPKSKISLTLLFLLYINQLEERRGDKISSTFSSLSRFHFHFLSISSSSSSSLVAGNFCSTSFFLLLRCVSWVFTLVSHVCFGWLLMRVVQIIKNVLLSWIHVYLLWNIKDLKLSTSEYERIEKCRKQDT